MCKLVCAEVFAMLTKLNIQTFDEIPANHWEQLAGEARAKVDSKHLGARAWCGGAIPMSQKQGEVSK